ncbi:twin-arginine translocation signal domain-containing protein [Halomicrococcus sp. NG-SE-24]|uniref:twin-arginine translocation signal domain-containing protein n=1 Tax=Halomicrococcus sp. NG-SE-24 TaxID=3436928 RepID=UPI003D97834C
MDENEMENTDTEAYEEEHEEDVGDESRRNFMKKGALASGAAALGLAGSSGSAAAQQRTQVLVFTYDYYPNVTFRVTQGLQASTTVNVLRRPGGGTVPEISQPDDYNGYVINYRLGAQGQQSAGITTLLFTRETLQTDARYRLAGDAQVFSSDLNLLSTNARRIGGGS